MLAPWWSAGFADKQQLLFDLKMEALGMARNKKRLVDATNNPMKSWYVARYCATSGRVGADDIILLKDWINGKISFTSVKYSMDLSLHLYSKVSSGWGTPSMPMSIWILRYIQSRASIKSTSFEPFNLNFISRGNYLRTEKGTDNK